MKKIETLDRFRGCLLGLAVGDALGTTLEGARPGTFKPIKDMIGGGPWYLKAGEWTDDTSMALCLAQSLIKRDDFDPLNQLQYYCWWWKTGYMSSNGECFDIGGTTHDALLDFERNLNPYVGEQDEHSAGNGSIMRLAPVPMFYSNDIKLAIKMSGESSRTTHGLKITVDACRYFGALIVDALNGVDKNGILEDLSYHDLFQEDPLSPEIKEIASGSFKRKEPPEIQGRGYVVKSLEAALWAFHKSNSFDEGALLAVNLGNDADSTGAVYGQLAGAYYGINGIRKSWRKKVVMSEMIVRIAEQLYLLSMGA